MTESLQIRQFNIREAAWETDGGQLSNIRRIVFIVEQKVPKDEEWDGKDEQSWHWLASDDKDLPIGTARLLPDGQIGRMAVLGDHRKLGVGAALLEAAVEKARHLGMSQVFLNAQSHALGFYEKLGFVAEGEEFLEAGIAHYRMTQTLEPPVDKIQRKARVDSELAISVKPFDTSEVSWEEAGKRILRMRRQVLTTELKLNKAFEHDDGDLQSLHWIAENGEGHPIGAIRMSPSGDVSRLIVLDDYRHAGIGYSLLELTIQRARRLGLPQLRLSALNKVEAFFEKAGFCVEGEASLEHGVLMTPMSLIVEPEDDELPHLVSRGESLNEDVTYQLGVDKHLILLRSESDFRNVILEMAGQAKRTIRIYSPLLSHDLFDHAHLRDICSRLARKNRYTRVEILIFDPHRVIKNGHALLNVARKLPSSIAIRVVDPEMRQLNHEYVLVDGEGVVYRQEHDNYEGTACFYDISQCNRLARQFTASWESGILDPNLRQIRI